MELEASLLNKYFEMFGCPPPNIMCVGYDNDIYGKIVQDAISNKKPITDEIMDKALRYVTYDLVPESFYETREDLIKFFQTNFHLIENQKIIFAQSNGGYKSKDEEDAYFTDEYFYVEFENGYKLKCSTLFYSLGDFEIDKDISKPNYNCWIIDYLKDRKFIDFEIIGFSDEYECNPTTGRVRPAGGDYYKEIIFKLDNGKTLTIVAEDAASDGYMDIFIK